jgi:voltage-gated potassium channel
MAQAIIRPTVTDFLELTLAETTRDIQMEEMPVHPASKLINVALQDSGIRKELDLIIVAVKKATGNMLFNPSSQTSFEAGDTVIAIGEKQNLEQLEGLLNPRHQIL